MSDQNTKQLKLTINDKMTGANSTYADNSLFSKMYSIDVEKFQIVDSISLDDFLTNNNIDEVELMKIDCEGAEYDIIYSSQLFKNNIVKNIVGEFHDLNYNIVSNKGSELYEYCKKYVSGILEVKILVA